MPVYMIRAGEHGPVKIGFSDDPETRLGQLQISHWETLRIIRLFEGGEAEEAALHARFSDHHIRGEWHHFSRAMLGDVGLAEVHATRFLALPEVIPAPVVLPAVGVAGRDPVINRAFSQRGVVKAIADTAGISTAAVSQWTRVPQRHVATVASITGIPCSELRPDLYSSDGAVQ